MSVEEEAANVWEIRYEYIYPKMGLPPPEAMCSDGEPSRGNVQMGNQNGRIVQGWVDFIRGIRTEVLARNASHASERADTQNYAKGGQRYRYSGKPKWGSRGLKSQMPNSENASEGDAEPMRNSLMSRVGIAKEKTQKAVLMKEVTGRI